MWINSHLSAARLKVRIPTLSILERVAHEATAAHLTPDGAIDAATWRGLSLRRLIGDPFDLTCRPVLPPTDTLAIRASADGASFVLHNRNAGNVASSGGMLGDAVGHVPAIDGPPC